MERAKIQALLAQGLLDDETARLMLNDLGQKMEGIPPEQRRPHAVAIARGPGAVARASSHGEGLVVDVQVNP